MSSGAGAQSYLSEILPKIAVIFKLRIIKQVDCPFLFFAESLSLSESFRWLRAILIAKLHKSLLNHLSHSKVPSLLILQLSLSDATKEVRAALTCHHFIILLVNFFSEGQLAGIWQPRRALTKPIINLVPIVHFWEGKARWVTEFVHIVDLVLIKRVNECVLARANLIHIWSFHNDLRYLILVPLSTLLAVITGWASAVHSSVSLIIGTSPVQAFNVSFRWGQTIKSWGVISSAISYGSF
jgi:hypothetical protein